MRDALLFGVAAEMLGCAISGAQPPLSDRAAIEASLPFVTARAA
jgi:hypothetical protein